MVKAVKVLFVILSVLLVCALCFACVQVAVNNPVSQPPVSSEDEVFSVDSNEPSVEVSIEESAVSEECFDEVSVEESSDEVSVEESSEDISELPPVGDTEPITPPPSSISTSEYDAYFNNSLFVGHSVMVHFKNYVNSWRGKNEGILGDAIMCCTSSFSFFNNINQTTTQADNVLPRYQGVPYKIEDLPAATGTGTIYIGLMGLNDLGMVGKADTCARIVADEVIQCIDKLKENSPEVKVVVLASTYLMRGNSFRNLNNRNMSLLNSYVLEYCNKSGIDFVDVATPLTDGGGWLASVYCSDNYCHLKQNAYYVWMDVLRDYAKQKTEDTWQNPQSIPLFEN